MLEKLETFIKTLPVPEQDRVILVIQDKSLSWIDVLEELKKGEGLATEIENKLKEKLK